MTLADQEDLGQRILSRLYLQDAVPLRRLAALAPAGHLDAALAKLCRDGMLAVKGRQVRLTPLGARMAYSLTSSDPHPLETLLGEVGADLPPSGRLLDLGCGPGAYLSDAVGSGRLAVVGLDRDEDSLNLASRSLRPGGRGAWLVRAEAERLPFLAGAFDAILCVMVLPYVREDRVLGEAARVLGKGGKMIMTAHGPGYYLGVLLGGGVTWKRRLFGAASLAGTVITRITGLRLPGARYQSARAISKMLADRGVRTVHAMWRGSCLGLPEGLRVLAQKGERTG